MDERAAVVAKRIDKIEANQKYVQLEFLSDHARFRRGACITAERVLFRFTACVVLFLFSLPVGSSNVARGNVSAEGIVGRFFAEKQRLQVSLATVGNIS